MRVTTQAFALRQWQQGSWVWWTGHGWSWNEARAKAYGGIGKARDAASNAFRGLGLDVEIVEV